MWRLPFQDVLGERRGLQLILVEGKLVNHHGLTVHTRETNNRMSRARWLREAWEMIDERVRHRGTDLCDVQQFIVKKKNKKLISR